MKFAFTASALLLAWSGIASAETAQLAPTATSPAPASDAPAAPLKPSATGPIRLPGDTVVRIELAEPVSSKDRTRGDKFSIRLSSPILVDGQTFAPAGSTGVGEVVYAERGGAGGSPGKLVLAARYVDVGAIRIRLKAFNLAAGGEQEFTEMQIASGFLGPAVMFIHGHNVLYPIGTRARAKVAEEVSLPAGAPSAIPAPPAAPEAAPATASSALLQELPK